MKRILISLLTFSVIISSVCLLNGCSQLDIAEQPDPVVIYAEKIYPSAVGNCLTDASVRVPAIDAYMDEYNKNADPSAVISYSTIKYNKDADYYYVNDKETDIGMKFRLDSTMSIVSASIYTGTLDQTDKNVYNIVINAIETSGYKSLMTDEDKAIIQHVLDGFESVAQAKQEVMEIFNGQENFAAKWENNIAEFEIPLKPTALPEPDRSHTLDAIVMPTVEIPTVTLDTTIVEGLHLEDGTPVKPADMEAIQDKITEATKYIYAMQEYNKTTPEGVNAVLDDMVIRAQELGIEKLLNEANQEISKLQQSIETTDLELTSQLTFDLENAYAQFEAQTKPDVIDESIQVLTNPSEFIDAVIGEAKKDMNFGSLDFDADFDIDALKGVLNDTMEKNGEIYKDITGKDIKDVITMPDLAEIEKQANASKRAFKRNELMDSSAGTSFFIPKGLKKDTPKDVVTKGITKYNKAQSDYQKQWNEKNNKCVKLEQQLAEAKFKGDTATVNKLQSQIDTLIKEMNSIQDKVNKMSIKSYVDKKYHA